MPDMTLCSNGCKDKAVCYRHTARPDKFQSYFLGTPGYTKEDCIYFIDNNFNEEKNNNVHTKTKRINNGCTKPR